MLKNIATRRHTSLIVQVVGLLIYASIPLFVTSPYYLDLLIMVMLNAVLAMMFIMTLRTGLINLGIIPFYGVGAYASAILSTELNISPWLCMPMAALFTGLVALAIGYFLIGSGASGLSFVILTTVIGMLFTVLVGNLSFLGAWNGIRNIPSLDSIKIPFLPAIEFDSKAQFFYLGLIIFLIIILITKALYASWTGRAWKAIGMNSRLAESLGINLFKFKMTSFVISCTLCGLAGSFFAHYAGFIHPNSFAMWQNIYVQVYAILGGLSYPIWGPFIGSVVMTLLPEFLRMTEVVAPIFTGLLLILLILFLPGGLLSLGKYRNNIGRVRKAISSFLYKGKTRLI